jgi:hypothetical protein
MMDSRLHLRVIASSDTGPRHRAELELGSARGPERRRFRRAAPSPDYLARAAVTVRIAGADDQIALLRLADLDSAAAPHLPVLIGEVAGRPVAALSLTDGALIADPFTPTLELVELLRLRARQIRSDGGAPPGVSRRAGAGVFGRITRAAGLAGSTHAADH